jgi:hypothetical protein
MVIVRELARLFGPWHSLYANSTVVSSTVTTLHIVTLVLSGGLAIAADRMTLRALRDPVTDRGQQLRELRAVHRPVVAALMLLLVSGALLAAADVETFAVSLLFWVKMGVVLLLLANGALLVRAERKLAHANLENAERGWRGLAVYARISVSLWIVITVLGVVLTNSA